MTPTHVTARDLPGSAQAERGPTRRSVLMAGGVVAAAAAVTAACGSPGTTSAGSTDGEAGSARPGSPAPAAGGASIATAEVPEGGGVILPEAQVVVTQPTAGDFKAFTAICTHMGCTVASIVDGEIECPCHGSQFSIADGSVTRGPASSPLATVAVTVAGDTITLA